MTEYMYLIRGGNAVRATKSPAQLQAELQKWAVWIEQLAKAGKFTAGDPLAQGGKVVTGSKKTVTDGPFAEAKDLVGGYLIVKAASLEEATEMARGCPIFENDGTVEVRAIQKMENM
jgi:hypothetical protein